MKRTERHHLKENEVAHWVLELKEQFDANRHVINYVLLAAVVVGVAVFGAGARSSDSVPGAWRPS